MPQTDDFRDLLGRLQWDVPRFARAAHIRSGNAAAMFRGDRPVPEPLMTWLRDMVQCADQLPKPRDAHARSVPGDD